MEKRTKRLLEKARMEAVVVTAPVDLFYLTGVKLSSGIFLALSEGSVLFVDGRYFEAVKSQTCFDVQLGTFEAMGKWIEGRPHVRQVAFDASTTTVAQLDQLKRAASQVEWIAQSDLLRSVRAVKDPSELDKLRASARLGSEGFDFLCSRLEVGVTERQLARQLEIFWLEREGEGLAFEPIIAFGPHSANPHHRPTDQALSWGDSVLLDLGVQKERYQSDMSRVVFFGEVSSQIRDIYTIVRRAFEAATATCKAGVTVAELDATARRVIQEAGHGERFTHSLGHGIGLEIHECPILRQRSPDGEMQLAANMVITIEPGIYLPTIGGVRLEDTVIVRESGCESLTCRSLEPLSQLK